MPRASVPPKDGPTGPRLMRFPRVTAWVLGLLVVVEFLQWTVVLPADVQAILGFRRGDRKSVV